MDVVPIYGDRRDIGHLIHGVDHHMGPDWRARLERDLPGHSSPRSDDRVRGLERSHYSPPRERRRRRSSTEDPQRGHQTKRVRRWCEKSRSGSRSSPSERGGSAEFLPRRHHHNSDDGRLSYWDDDYNDVQTSSTVSSDERRRPVPAVYQPPDSLEAEIQRLYPDADVSWVSDMAGFDVDEFFHGLNDNSFAVSINPSDEDAQMEKVIFDDDDDDNQALPTVRLPPVKHIAADKISEDTKTFFHRHQSPTNDTEERSWYGFQEGDNDRTSHDHSSEVIVKFPQGTCAALNMSRFSAKLEINSSPPAGLKPEFSPDVMNDKGERPLRDTSSNTDNGDISQETMMLDV